MKYRLAIFDLDGTVLNTLDDLAAAANAALEMHGFPRHSVEDVRRFVGNGVAKLIRNHQVKRLIASHVGLNPEVGQQMNAGELQVDLLPQGSFVEMIRAGGSGLGAVVTPTGVDTTVEDSPFVYSKVELAGKKYLMMQPLRADFALVSGYYIDRKGNIWYRGTTRNFNHVMALAANTVIAEADYVVDCGQIAPENVVTPGIFVDYVVDGGRAK